MLISDLREGLRILSRYTNNFSLEVVPRSFPNGAPDHSHSAYVVVEIPNGPQVSKSEAKALAASNWVGEANGWCWCFRNF